jgi:hypothetical protein
MKTSNKIKINCIIINCCNTDYIDNIQNSLINRKNLLVMIHNHEVAGSCPALATERDEEIHPFFFLAKTW